MSDDIIVEQPKRPVGRPPRQEEVKAERRRRAGSGIERHLRLSIPEEYKDPNYVYRWINDNLDRVKLKTTQDDWDIVHEHELPNATVKQGEGEGTPIKRIVGRGPDGLPMPAYLCRKRKDYYQADKAKEQKAIEDAENAVLTHKTAAGSQGLNPSSPDDKAYIPGGL